MTPLREMRYRVIARDGGCVAPLLDPEAGPCYDQWGAPVPATSWPELEIDHVRWRPGMQKHKYAADHVAMCPGHHRGTGPNAGAQWATGHRPQLRAYLEQVCTPRGRVDACERCQAEVVWHRGQWLDTDTWEPHAHAR